MIEVELPDGTIAEFPDGTSNEAIKGALQKRFVSQQRQSNPNEGLPYGQPPEGMVLNPATGQMEDLRNAANPNIPEVGVLNSAALGAGQGIGFNLMDEAVAGASALTGGDYDYDLARMRELERRASEENPAAYYGGQAAGALGTGAGMAASGASLGANAINAGWRLPGVMVASGAEGLGMGGLYGFGAGEGLQDRLAQSETGAKWGGALGLAAPLIVSGASKLAEKAISPFRAPADRVAAVNYLQQEGVPLSAGQKTGSKWLQYRESELGGARAADLMDEQARAFTDAAMRRAGGSGLADPDNLSALRTTLDQGFTDISARNTLQLDQGLAQDLLGTLNEYNRVLPAEQRQILGNIASDIGDRLQAGNGTMTGKDYQTIRSRLTKRANNVKGSDNELANAYKGLRNALDSAMDRSINPNDAGVWSELRRQWGNLKVLNKASGGGGEAAGFGVISPARLRMAASSGNQEGFATGASDFTKLAKAGQALMTPLPNSGTAQRLASQGVTAALLGGVGGAGAGPAGLALGLAGPALAGRTLMSGPVQRYLANQIMNGPIDPIKRAIATALATSSGSALAGRLPSP
ncbi:hypothetical protein NN6n1_13280 [Shinella zoogloeoides]